jgi:hypothetical protein
MQFESIAARWHERGDMSLLQPAMYCPRYFALIVLNSMMVMADAGKREQELLFRAGGASIASRCVGSKLLAGVEQTETA